MSDDYQYQQKPLPVAPLIGEDATTAASVAALSPPNFPFSSDSTLNAPLGNAATSGGGGGGGGIVSPTCATSWQIGSIATSQITLSCTSSNSLITQNTISLEDTLSIKTADIDSDSGVVQMRELDVCHMGAPGKRQFICGASYAP